MKQNAALTIASLITVLLMSLHLADDIVRGMEEGTVANLAAVPILVLWLYATVVLAGRRSGYVIVLVLSLLALGIPPIHMSGRGVGINGAIGHTRGALFFVWTLIAMETTALFSVILSARSLWSLRRRPAAAPDTPRSTDP